ncbi:hypothetical protein G6F57_022620 [Rhizopus arrhizus]|nr:hypothetical protein G6F57_022620 [Rhizopus arrhizus]
MPLGIAVHAGRVQPTHDFRPHAQGLVHQFQRARADQQPALREGHKFHVDLVAVLLAGAHHAFDGRKPDLRIHVHVTANVAGAVGDRHHDLPRRLPIRVDAQALFLGALVLDLID